MSKLKTVTEFTTALVKWGGVNSVDKEYFITEPKGDRTTVAVAGQHRQIRIPFDGMLQDMTNKSTLFIPLVEPIGHTSERKWFFTTRTHVYGNLVKDIMRRIIEICAATESDNAEPNYDQLAIAQVYNERVNATLGKIDSNPLILKELEKLDPLKLLRPQYSRRKKVIQLQTDLYNDELMEELKIRKKSVALFREMFGDIMSSVDIHEDYTFMAVQMGMPEIECFINMMQMFAVSVNPFSSKLLGIELYPEELTFHIQNLHEYRKSCGHLVGATMQQDMGEKENKVQEPIPNSIPNTRIPGGCVINSASIPGTHSMLPTVRSGIPAGVPYGHVAERAMVDPTFNPRAFLSGIASGQRMIGTGYQRPMIGPGSSGQIPKPTIRSIPKLPSRK